MITPQLKNNINKLDFSISDAHRQTDGSNRQTGKKVSAEISSLIVEEGLNTRDKLTNPSADDADKGSTFCMLHGFSLCCLEGKGYELVLFPGVFKKPSRIDLSYVDKKKASQQGFVTLLGCFYVVA
jgi:hypothetical protein